MYVSLKVEFFHSENVPQPMSNTCRVMMTYNLSLIWIKSRENEHTIKGLCFTVYSSLDNIQLKIILLSNWIVRI